MVSIATTRDQIQLGDQIGDLILAAVDVVEFLGILMRWIIGQKKQKIDSLPCAILAQP